MKILKKGFSLAELLIALAIVSIIATLGFTIAKKNVEKAYNLYFYTAYSELQRAIADANAQGFQLKDCVNNMQPDKWTSECKFTEHIKTLFNAEDLLYMNEDYQTRTLKTQNNIIYKFQAESSVTSNDFSIQVYIPAQRHTNSDGNIVDSISAYFEYKETLPVLLIPKPTNLYDQDIDLQNRIDLLPFYIDDGTNGKIKTDYDTNNQELKLNTKVYEKLNYYSFREAYCRAYGKIPNKLDCTDIQDTGKTTGVIKVADPRKVF